MPEQRQCPPCGTYFKVYPSAIKRGEGTYCSRACSNPARGRAGASNGNWRGGKFQRSDGYVAIRVGGTYELEHRLVVERSLGRKLGPREHVHHLNHIKDDNRLSNLVVLTIEDHAREHHDGPQPATWVLVRCLHCGAWFERYLNWVERHPRTYCSRECYRRAARAT
jgi:hypothetical protein